MSLTKKQLIESYNSFFEKFKLDLLEKIDEKIDDKEGLKEFIHSYAIPEFKKESSGSPRKKKVVEEKEGMKQAEVWLENVCGIQYYVDKMDNVYLVESFLHQQEHEMVPMAVYGKLCRNEDTEISGITIL